MVDKGGFRGEGMAGWEAVCDCCMARVPLETASITVRDCPHCGVGRLLGPWRVSPRFQGRRASRFEIAFRRPDPKDPEQRD